MKPIHILVSALVLCPPAMLNAEQATLTDDATFQRAQPDANFGSLPQLQISPTTLVLLRFSLDALPKSLSDTAIGKATLHLYVNRLIVPGTVSLYRMDSTWSEKTVTQSNLPQAYLPPTASIPVDTVNQYAVLDVTEEVRAAWRSGANAFSGILNSTAEAFLDSKENTATSQPPLLDIQLTGPQGPQGLTGIPGGPGPKGDKGTTGSSDVLGNFSTYQVADFSISGSAIVKKSLSCPASYPQLVAGGCGFPFLSEFDSVYKIYYSGPDPDNSNGAWRCSGYNGSFTSQTMRLYINCSK